MKQNVAVPHIRFNDDFAANMGSDVGWGSFPGVADITVRWERAKSLQFFLALVQCLSAFVVTLKKPFI